MKKIPPNNPVPLERIQGSILLIRGKRVMLDSDLARLYGVSTKRLYEVVDLNEQVKRNKDRFPGDFMFQLSKTELKDWRSHFATSNPAVKMGLRRPPYAFTEHGALQLASVLTSPKATQVSLLIVRAFVQLREILSTHTQIADKLVELERKIASHDETIVSLVQAIQQLMEPPTTYAIGFQLRKRDID